MPFPNSHSRISLGSHYDRLSPHYPIYITKASILSREECQRIIRACEEYVEDRPWSTSRHYSVPTTDLPLHELRVLNEWFLHDIFLHRISPMMHAMYLTEAEIEEKKMRETESGKDCYGIYVYDLFVVKYSAETTTAGSNIVPQRFLPLHRDQSSHSIVIALNDCQSDFSGGGTYFNDLHSVVNPTFGQMVCFPGDMLHSGDPVLTGTRYIIAGFFLLYKISAADLNHSLLDVCSTQNEVDENRDSKKRKVINNSFFSQDRISGSDSASFTFNFL
jgi:hypothetical protein